MRILKTGIILGACAIICVGAMAFAQKRDYPVAPAYVPLPSGHFPIRASYAFYPPFIDRQQFEWVKEAGFNTLNKILDIPQLDSVLVLAEENDLYVAGCTWKLNTPQRVREFVETYGKNPRIWGIGLSDEPSARKFKELGALSEAVVLADPEQNALINLLPEVKPEQMSAPDYRTYVEEFVRIVNPPLISYDSYPVRKKSNGSVYVGDDFYRTITVISEVARESGRPFWGYILSNRHAFYPKPKEAYIRFQVFANLAYGAQGLSYFTYLHPDFDLDKGDFSDSPIDASGQRTLTWHMVKAVNTEVHNLEHVFLGAEILNVGLTGSKIPSGAKKFNSLPEPFTQLRTGSEGVIVSHLRNSGKEYLLLVNRDVSRKQKIKLERKQEVMRIMPDGKITGEKQSTLSLSPGSFALYSL